MINTEEASQLKYCSVNSLKLYTANQHLFSFDLDKSQRLIIKNYTVTKLLDSEFFEGLEISNVTNSLCNSVKNMTV